MKISPEHYTVLIEAIRPLVPRLTAHREAIVREGKAQDIEKRLRWDALWAAKIDGRDSCFFLSDKLSPLGIKDAHIDTALREIMRELGVTP